MGGRRGKSDRGLPCAGPTFSCTRAQTPSPCPACMSGSGISAGDTGKRAPTPMSYRGDRGRRRTAPPRVRESMWAAATTLSAPRAMARGSGSATGVEFQDGRRLPATGVPRRTLHGKTPVRPTEEESAAERRSVPRQEGGPVFVFRIPRAAPRYLIALAVLVDDDLSGPMGGVTGPRRPLRRVDRAHVAGRFGARSGFDEALWRRVRTPPRGSASQRLFSRGR